MKRLLFAAAGTVMLLVTAAVCIFFSTAIVNSGKYPVMGVDVSRYQGKIDWDEFESQNVSFAFIKATEGSSHVDEFAAQNLENAAKTDIMISAYHFFSFDSPGRTQAENYISVVGSDRIDMPPVVDIEYYGDKKHSKPDREDVKDILCPLLDRLEEYYGAKPIIYSTLPVYNRYLRDGFSEYPLWIRNVNCEPEFTDWDFWQYSDKGCLSGFEGKEKYIDLNVFRGSVFEIREKFGIFR